MCTCDIRDIAFCKQYAKDKPAPVPLEFLDLVEILMEDENLHMPDNCYKALSLYMDLVQLINE